MASGFGCVVLIATACLIQVVLLAKEKIYYVDFEHVNVTYLNPKYLRNVNVTCQRHSRRDPVHYCHIHLESLVAANNNVLLDYYAYEFLSNEYRPSFVEAHFRLCDLLFHNPMFSPIFNLGLLKSCPIPKMTYNLQNLSLVGLPFLRTFPFQKGRLFLNVTLRSSDSQLEHIASAYVDGAIKEMWR